jgi:hypothetical protein
VMVAEVNEALMAEAGLEVKLDRLAVGRQGRRLDIGLGLPPPQPPV